MRSGKWDGLTDAFFMWRLGFHEIYKFHEILPFV